MRRLFALMMCAVSFGAAAQITYPYNPDGNADSLISVPDIQDFLAVYGNTFVPNEVMVEDSTLSSWILSLSETASQQAAMISSLSELLNEQATIIDSLMDDGDEVHMFSIDSIQSGDWITIASVGELDQAGLNLPSMRADALFDFTYNRAAGHQRVQVKASHLFGKSNQLDIEHNRFYDNGSAISAFRIAFDNTYDGAVLQMRIQQPTCCQSEPVVMRIANNRNVPGWVVNPQILSNSVTSDNQPMVYGQVSDVVPFTQFYPSEAGTSLLEGDRTQAYMNTELHVNDLIVHGSVEELGEASIEQLYYAPSEACSYPGKISFDLEEGLRVCRFVESGICSGEISTTCTGEMSKIGGHMYLSFEVSDTVWVDINKKWKKNNCSYNNYGSQAYSVSLSSFPSNPEWNPSVDGWGAWQAHGLAVPGRTFVARVEPGSSTHRTQSINLEGIDPIENVRFWNSNGEEVDYFYAAYGRCPDPTNPNDGYYYSWGNILLVQQALLMWQDL